MNVFPIAYFPPISYFQKILKEESVVFEVKEHYLKQTLRNRCTILTANGTMDLSIPVVRANGSKTKTDDIVISHHEDWRKVHWRAIESAYANSPYFDTYDREIKELIYQEENHLVSFTITIIKAILEFLDLPLSYSLTADYQGITTNIEPDDQIKPYYQVFNEKGKANFTPDLSILDLLFAEGPMARTWLRS